VTRLITRYKIEGVSAFEPKSRELLTSPSKISESIIKEIVDLRKKLSGLGLDAGPETIGWHLEHDHQIIVSTSTIRRYLVAAGLVVPEPRKRPKSSYIRFEADLPNEMWQTDMTHWQLAEDTGVEILSFIDDHSRYALSVQVCDVVNTRVVIQQFKQTAETQGIPASVLSDNGMYYTTRFTHYKTKNSFELLLKSLGINQKHGKPYRPTTQGKVERFQQTMKKWLRAKPQTQSIEELQTQINDFVDYYNNKRPHRSLNRRTPSQVYNLRPKAMPVKHKQQEIRIRKDIIGDAGKITLRHDGKLYHIGIGRKYKRTRILMIVQGLHIRIINEKTGEQLRELTLNPNKNYQPQNKKKNPLTGVHNVPMS